MSNPATENEGYTIAAHSAEAYIGGFCLSVTLGGDVTINTGIKDEITVGLSAEAKASVDANFFFGVGAEIASGRVSWHGSLTKVADIKHKFDGLAFETQVEESKFVLQIAEALAVEIKNAATEAQLESLQQAAAHSLDNAAVLSCQEIGQAQTRLTGMKNRLDGAKSTLCEKIERIDGVCNAVSASKTILCRKRQLVSGACTRLCTSNTSLTPQTKQS